MKLKNGEIIRLFNELHGIDESFQGILKKEISFKTKSMLHKLSDFIKDDVASFEKLRKELIEKYGDSSDKEGEFVVSPEKQILLNQEFEELLNVEIPIDVSSIWAVKLTMSNFEDLKTKEDYPVLYKILE